MTVYDGRSLGVIQPKLVRLLARVVSLDGVSEERTFDLVTASTAGDVEIWIPVNA